MRARPAKSDEVRERIIDATLVCIERNGLEATGVRDIAQEADVNGAAINYYFGSKDALLETVLNRALDKFYEGLAEFDAFVEQGHSVRQALEALLDDVVANTGRYPRLSYAFLHDAMSEQRYDGAAMRRMNDFIEGLVKRLLKSKKSAKREQRLRVALTQVWSVVVMCGLLPRFFEHTGHVDLKDEAVRKAFTLQLVRSILPDDDEPA